jgi:predicted nucleotidyltransferase
MDSLRISLKNRPRRIRDGEVAIVLPKRLVEKDDEIALGARLVCNRRLFGACYRGIVPNFYDSIGRDGGVMVSRFVRSNSVLPAMSFPGDIDLLVVPYENDELVVSETLAIELKAVRAKFAKQGKSPNEYGFSQAKALLSHGFPYSAVVHLITSDASPEDSWRKILVARVIDADAGTVEDPWETSVDLLPANLIDRCFGRLRANCDDDKLGLAAVYIKHDEMWSPSTRPARKNLHIASATLEAIAACYEKSFQRFMDIPKY